MVMRIICLFLLGILMTGCKDEKTFPTESFEPLLDLNFSNVERDSMQDALDSNLEGYKKLHSRRLDNGTPPAFNFDPRYSGFRIDTNQQAIDWKLPLNIKLPESADSIAFLSVAELSNLIKNQKITSQELTQIYLSRLKKFGDTLQCVITITEQLALEQAKRADQEISAGNYRGPLHGIPYGLKDLFSVNGYKTTWGAAPYKDQVINTDATVYKKLTEAGAVLVAKLSLGALAWGDVWYEGKTKNPWDLEEGSSGSSAGSASATAAGLVAFAIGTETHGSIVSPATRCGLTGLRPTFGRVSRTGGMNLSWTMDKIGPICRTAFDCALVFNAIKGADGVDQSAVDAPFNYETLSTLKGLKIGYFEKLFLEKYDRQRDDVKVIAILQSLGAKMKSIELPDYPREALNLILNVEAAAFFDELTRSNKDSLMVRQIKRSWPNQFRQARFVPAVEYINANRLRRQLIEELNQLFSEFDMIVAPSFRGNQLLFTNLTGHPCVVLPNSFERNGKPTSITFLGNLYEEDKILAVARLYQERTDYHEKHPELFYDAALHADL
ncbi:MAG: amidase [Cyclobacteriaceae bacterium]